MADDAMGAAGSQGGMKARVHGHRQRAPQHDLPGRPRGGGARGSRVGWQTGVLLDAGREEECGRTFDCVRSDGAGVHGRPRHIQQCHRGIGPAAVDDDMAARRGSASPRHGASSARRSTRTLSPQDSRRSSTCARPCARGGARGRPRHDSGVCLRRRPEKGPRSFAASGAWQGVHGHLGMRSRRGAGRRRTCAT